MRRSLYLLQRITRCPLQSSDDFENFLSNFELILGDFSCKSNSWWEGDISTKEGIDLESLSLFHGLHQLITDPTDILPQSSSCIDLIFIGQTNLVIKSGVYSSLHASCHHQVTHCQLNLKIVFPLHMRD